MEEQKQAEQQWNKIRQERINILKEAPSCRNTNQMSYFMRQHTNMCR